MGSGSKSSLYNIAEAKAHLPELVERAHAGETIIVARAGKPKARLVPLENRRANLRVPGKGKGRFKAAPGFDDRLPPDVIEQFESGRDCGALARLPLATSGAG